MGEHHHAGEYHATSKQLRALANATPAALCCRCARTLDQHPPHKNGKPAKWTAEHTMPGSTTWQPWWTLTQIPPAGDWLAVSASTCNYSAQATPVGPIQRTTREW